MARFRLFGRRTDEVSERELKHRQLARTVAAEGMVLLKNDGVLPLQSKKIALFGAGARMTVKGGTGSGNMQERYSVNIEDGLKNAGFTITSTRWLDRFDASFAAEKEAWRLGIEERIKHYKPWEVQRIFDEVIHVTPLRFPIGDEIQPEDLPEDTDTAIYVVARQAGESTDRRLEKGDYYLSDVEETNIRILSERYEKVLLVINCGGILDLSILDDVPNIGAAVHFVQGGEEGGNAFADVVSGKVTPSGKLTDTWGKDYYDYPSADEFGILGDVLNQDYKEGIFVGYRWFDVNGLEPRWPFGYGLSYADFEITAQKTQIAGATVTVNVSVRNMSSTYSGKEVVQLYIAKPNGKLCKERKSLAAFSKTKLLAPGEQEVCTLRFDLRDQVSYDEETACKLLEAGEYGIYLGSDSRKNDLCAVLTLDRTVVTEKLTNILPVPHPIEVFTPNIPENEYPADVARLMIDADAFGIKEAVYKTPEPVIKTTQTGEYIQSLSDMLTVQSLSDFIPLPGAGKIKEYSFRQVGKVYDNVLATGMKPFVELSFMPTALASGKKFGLHYRNNITPPKNYEQWGEYVRAFVQFLVDRYGREEVESWYFEVWNEPDLGVFFTGKQEDYFKLYRYTVNAIKSVDDRIPVGGPSTSEGKWLREFLEFVDKEELPCDFVSTHQYPGDGFGNTFHISDVFTKYPKIIKESAAHNRDVSDTITEIFFHPEDVKLAPKGVMREAVQRSRAAVGDRPLFYTEWNCMSVFGSPAHDDKYSAAFAIKTLLDMNHETDCFSIWCCNDLFEEIMFINKPFHGGFGLMTNLGIPKPVFWAFKLLADSYPQRLALPRRTDADVEYAVFRDGERYQVFVYSQAVDYLENRSFSVELSLDRQFSSARMVRIDDDHCNPKAIWQQLGSPMDPTPAQVETIKDGSKPIEETVAFRSENGCTHIPLMLSSNDVIVLYLE